MRDNNVTYEPTYKGHPINTDKSKKQGCYTEILDKELSVLGGATEDHQKVLFFRFDLRYPKGYNAPTSNEDIARFNENFLKGLRRAGLDPRYIWARERSTEKHQHYHCACVLDGSKTYSPHHHLDRAERCWNKLVGVPVESQGYVDRCDRGRNGLSHGNGVMLRRGAADFERNFNECFRWCSYLAKVNTKNGVPKGRRQFGGTETAKGEDEGKGNAHASR